MAPIFDFQCDKCKKIKEDLVKSDLSDSPVNCGCGGKYSKLMPNRFAFDIIGPGCYMNDYGKHAWKKRMGPEDQAKVLAGEKDPY